MNNSRNMTAILISLSFVCSGCLAAFINVDTPRVELTALEQIKADLDAFFATNKGVYENADTTIATFNEVPKTYRVSPSEFQIFARSILGTGAIEIPERIGRDQRAKLNEIGLDVRALRRALMSTGKRSKSTASFILKKTQDLESELAKLKATNELVKRSPLASRRDKGRAANQIRKANRIVASTKTNAKSEQQALARLQARGLKSLATLLSAFKAAGIEAGASAAQATRSMQLDATEQATNEAAEIVSPMVEQTATVADETMNAVESNLAEGEAALTESSQGLRNQISTGVKKTKTATEAKLKKNAKKAKIVINEELESLTNEEDR